MQEYTNNTIELFNYILKGEYKNTINLLSQNPELIFATNRYEQTLLHVAAMQSNPRILSQLLKIAPDDVLTAKDFEGSTILHSAVEFSAFDDRPKDSVELILRNPKCLPQLYQLNRYNRYPIDLSAENILDSKNKDPSSLAQVEITKMLARHMDLLFKKAIKHGDLYRIEQMIEHHIAQSTAHPEYFSQSALHSAVYHSNKSEQGAKILGMLLQNQVYRNQLQRANSRNNTPIAIASDIYHEDHTIYKTLVDMNTYNSIFIEGYKSDEDYVERYKHMMHQVAADDNVEVLRLLLPLYSSTPMIYNNDLGRTILHTAVTHDAHKVATLLTECDVYNKIANLKDDEGKSALDLTKSGSKIESVILFSLLLEDAKSR